MTEGAGRAEGLGVGVGNDAAVQGSLKEGAFKPFCAVHTDTQQKEGYTHKTMGMKLNTTGEAIRTDKDHMIVPAVITMEGVHNGCYKSAAEVLAAVDMAQHRYVTFNHPDKWVVTDRAEIRGHMENIRTRAIKRDVAGVQYELPQVLADLYLCTKRCSQAQLQAIRDGKVQEVSIGYWCIDTPQGGHFLGEAYQSQEHNILIDHTAILLNGTGACECREDGTGCGILHGASVAEPGGNGSTASLVPTQPGPSADTISAPIFHTDDSAKTGTLNTAAGPGKEGIDMTEEVKEVATVPQEEVPQPAAEAAPPTTPSVEDDATAAANVARAAALQAKVDAYELQEREATIDSILALKGTPKDNVAGRAAYAGHSLSALKDRLGAMNDMAAIIHANLIKGAGTAAASTTNVVLEHPVTGATVGMSINGKWTGGYDEQKK